MKFAEPFKVYTAASNLEAHSIVVMLNANGIDAMVETDDSGASFFGYGITHQFHQPYVWIEKSAADEAQELIRRFEETKRSRNLAATKRGTIQVVCGDCGSSSSFARRLEGTTQECRHCGEFLDVEEFVWDAELFDEDEEST